MRCSAADGQVTKRLHYPAPKNLGLSPELLAEIKDGLIKAAHDLNGTSSAIFGNFTPTVAGKTGTAEVPPDDPNAWYAAFAPADQPRLVVVALITNGGHGGTAAAPAALKMFQAFFGTPDRNGKSTCSPSLIGVTGLRGGI